MEWVGLNKYRSFEDSLGRLDALPRLFFQSFRHKGVDLLLNDGPLADALFYQRLVLLRLASHLVEPIDHLALLPDLHLALVLLVPLKHGLPPEHLLLLRAPYPDPTAQHHLARPVPLHQVPVLIDEVQLLPIAPSPYPQHEVGLHIQEQPLLWVLLGQVHVLRLQLGQVAGVGHLFVEPVLGVALHLLPPTARVHPPHIHQHPGAVVDEVVLFEVGFDAAVVAVEGKACHSEDETPPQQTGSWHFDLFDWFVRCLLTPLGPVTADQFVVLPEHPLICDLHQSYNCGLCNLPQQLNRLKLFIITPD